MYSGWNIGTALGALLGAALPSPTAFGIDLVAPLAFLAVLVPLVRTRPMMLVALAAGGTAYLVSQVAPSGLAVLGAGLAGCLLGGWLMRDEAGASVQKVGGAS
jgi:predicted branched-subunit amino acid permease